MTACTMRIRIRSHFAHRNIVRRDCTNLRCKISTVPIFRFIEKAFRKITNVVFVSNPNQSRSTQAIFSSQRLQARRMSLLPSRILRCSSPTKYQKDNFAGPCVPFEFGENILLSPMANHLPKGNNGAHVPLQDLLSYRASTNHISAQLIDVANIYDEFHYGSPSANAIKSFLTYAYNNWQDPPKYVLLAGVTHEGTDDPEVYFPNDQVSSAVYSGISRRRCRGRHMVFYAR